MLFFLRQEHLTNGEAPGLVVNVEDSQSEPPWTWVRIPATPKKLYGNEGSLNGRKTNKNNKDSQMGQVTPKKIKKEHLTILCLAFKLIQNKFG